MSTWQELLRIIRLARPELRLLVWGTVALLITSGLSLAWPQLIRLIIDGILEGGGESSVNRWAGWLVVLLAVSAVLTGLRSYLFTVAGERIVARLRTTLYESVVRQEVAFFDRHRTGELTNRLASDTTVIQNAATVNISMLLRYGITALGTLAILMWTSWRLTLVMLALVPIAVAGALFYGRYIRRLSKKVQDALAEATGVAEESLSGIRTVRAFAREEVESARYGEKVERSFDLARQVAYVSSMFGGLAAFAGYGAIAGVLWYGGILLANGRMSMGELTSFLLYTMTLGFAMATLAGLWRDFMRAVGASERIFELIERAPEVTSGEARLEALRGELRFEGVEFTYPTRPEAPVLKGLDLHLAPGEVVAVVGPSGGGKSTIAALISRFYDPDGGAITLDGEDLRTLEPQWLREQVGVVAQEPILFATSIAENILYGRPTATMEEVERAAVAANAADFVEALPEAYETAVGERGLRLSGGQKQRVAIARALLKGPRVLILDEATSALDAESEHLVQQALENLMAGRTTLVIAHRLSTVKSADRIVVLDSGRVVEQGSHDALIEAGGLYRQLVDRQFES